MLNPQHGVWEKVVNFSTLIIVLQPSSAVMKTFSATGMGLVLENVVWTALQDLVIS